MKKNSARFGGCLGEGTDMEDRRTEEETDSKKIIHFLAFGFSGSPVLHVSPAFPYSFTERESC